MTCLFKASPMIICEVGSNWTNFTEAKDSISFAKQCGADAVKFQLFDWMSLYGIGLNANSEMWDEKLTGAMMPIDWLPKLKEKADACGIEFMCSAFSEQMYDVVDQYVEVHKIASSETNHPHLLSKVASFKKPILFSVGASSKGDIHESLKYLPASLTTLMYCASAYPSRYSNLFMMEDLKASFNLPVGLSDHTRDVIYHPLSAVKHFGAVVIEKHVNFTNHRNTPDAPHSLDHEEFAYMCQILKGTRPYDQFNPQPEEREMFLRHNRRLIAIKDIPKDSVLLQYGVNYGAFRSLKDDAHGLNPMMWLRVEGKVTTKDLKAGDPIGPGDFFDV